MPQRAKGVNVRAMTATGKPYSLALFLWLGCMRGFASAASPPSPLLFALGSKVPLLAPVGPAELVWNQSSDRCPGLNHFGHIGEQPDSLPIAWHDPLTNTTSLIASTSWGTFASKGKPSLHEAHLQHDCSHRVFTAPNLTTPWSYANHQWLQSTRMHADGSGTALIHNEFHGEQLGNESYCSYDHKTNDGRCILWSTVIGQTNNGGATWGPVFEDPAANVVFTLPHRYTKDAPIGGYGALSPVHCPGNGSFCYGMVFRHNATEQGMCAFRSGNMSDPQAFRKWDGNAWASSWINPYLPYNSSESHECATIIASSHVTIRRLSSSTLRPNSSRWQWPEYIAITWNGENGFQFMFSNWTTSEADFAFTKWTRPQTVQISEWLDPRTIGGYGEFMYPGMLDVDSPWLDSGPSVDALSYNLIGNRTYIYFVMGRKLWARLPVALFDPDGPQPPKPPFPRPSPNPLNCSTFDVSGAGSPGVNGLYVRIPSKNITDKPAYMRAQADTAAFYEPQRAASGADSSIMLYCFSQHSTDRCSWQLGVFGHPPVFYSNDKTLDDGSVPVDGWKLEGGVPPFPVVKCSGTWDNDSS